MEKSNYKLFFYLKDKPINLNLNKISKTQTQSPPHETRAKLFNQDIQKNIYNKSKLNYEFLTKKNKNIFILNKKGGKLPSKEYIQALVNFDKKIKSEDLSLLPFPLHKKENNKSVEELRRIQRNKVTMRRIEYSMKVKHTTTKKRSKYNIKKVITIQKWIRGFLIRNLLSNWSDLEDIKNEFLIHIKKFCFLKYMKNIKNVINYMINKEISNNQENLNDKKENERYIDDDSFLEYNTRYNNNNKNVNKNINNNLLFFSSKDFSDKINLNQNNNNINNLYSNNNDSNSYNSNILLTSGGGGELGSTKGGEGIAFNNLNKIKNLTPTENNNNNKLFKLNESSISFEDGNKNTFNTFNDLNIKNIKINNDNNINTNNNINNKNNIITNNILKTEINEDIDLLNNNQLFIRHQKFNKKFLEEITNAPPKFNTEGNININNINNNSEEKNINNNKIIKNNNNNQLLSISNPTNSTLDSNTLNINRKLILEENIRDNIYNQKKNDFITKKK